MVLSRILPLRSLRSFNGTTGYIMEYPLRAVRREGSVDLGVGAVGAHSTVA